jgi:hypothetical protein
LAVVCASAAVVCPSYVSILNKHHYGKVLPNYFEV